MNAEQAAAMLRRFAEATAPGVGEEEALRGIETILGDHAGLPASATLAGVPVTVESMERSGTRRGITATVVRRNRRYRVSLFDLEFAPELAIAACVEAYRCWADGVPAGRAGRQGRSPRTTALPEAPGSSDAPGGPLDVVVFAVGETQATVRLLTDDRDARLRLTTFELSQLIPGEIATVATRRTWSYGTRLYLSGSLVAHRFDATRLGLVPLALTYQDDWDPRELFEDELSGQSDEDLPGFYLPILAAGARPRYETTQVIPGSDPMDDEDDIVRAAELNQFGDRRGARKLLMGLLEQDLRCVDAHAHLGNFVFDADAGKALRHYQVGAAIAEMSLPGGFSGLLPWSFVDNRPYLRCVMGAGLCQWRLGLFEQAEQTLERMLWLNPMDDQGARMLIDDVRARRPWRPG